MYENRYYKIGRVVTLILEKMGDIKTTLDLSHKQNHLGKPRDL